VLEPFRAARDMQQLSAYQKVQLARHPQRPYFLDYIEQLCADFIEIHGDRSFADDPAIVTGFAMFRKKPICVIGHQKGRDTKQKLYRNFGMPKPEGYRKALRVMKMAEKFGRPVLTFIDTPGAYPGIDAEERGQAEAIAVNLREMSQLRVPIIATVTGEGGSGGALAIGVGDRVNMLESSIYSVIAPESCSAILWRDQQHAAEAAEALKLTPEDLKRFQMIDEIVSEPEGGAHNNHAEIAQSLGKMLERQLAELSFMKTEELLSKRYAKFRAMGVFGE
jgi:acetyl-CoA carboxylase carboxyl transferase subunit alpha